MVIIMVWVEVTDIVMAKGMVVAIGIDIVIDVV